MTHRKITLVVVGLAACLALAGAAHARQPRLALSGRVMLQSQEQRGQPRFTVRLYYPKAANRPTLVTHTKPDGQFRFDDIDAGRYLLEIYQGSEMVYQKALTLDENYPQPLVITLRAGG